MADRRIKGCPNENCEAHIQKMKYSSSDSYCTKCSSPLVFVCAKCFDEIQDIGETHRICKRCESEKQDRNEKIKDTVKEGAKKAVAVAAAFVGPVAVGIADKVKHDSQKTLIDKGVKFVKDTAQKIIKK